MSTTPFDAYFSPEALEKIRLCEGVDAYHARVNGAHIRSVYQNIPTSLNLFFHKFGNYFTILLADALCENTSVETLGLEMNQIGNRGAKALAWALSVNHSVLKVDLSNNHIGAEGILALAHGAMRQSRMIVSWNVTENMNRQHHEAFSDVERAYHEVIAILRQSKTVLEYHGPYERDLKATIQANRMRVELLADIVLHNPESITREQLADLQEAYGALYHLFRDSGYSRQAVITLFSRVEKVAARYHCTIRVPCIPEIRATAHFMPGKHAMSLLMPGMEAESDARQETPEVKRKEQFHS